MRLRYLGKCDARVGDRLFCEGDSGEFETAQAQSLIDSGSWASAETKTTKRTKKSAANESQNETGS